MPVKHIGLLCVTIGLGTILGGCTDGYGYGGVAVGYGGQGYYDDPYGYAGYGGVDPGYGYGGYAAPSYFGWYGDYYYPGTGVYVYDRDRRAHRWNGNQQRYWRDQQRYRRTPNGAFAGTVRGSWNGFDRGVNAPPGRRDGDARRWQGRRDTPGIAPPPAAPRYRDTPGSRRADTPRSERPAAERREPGGNRFPGRGGRVEQTP